MISEIRWDNLAAVALIIVMLVFIGRMLRTVWQNRQYLHPEKYPEEDMTEDRPLSRADVRRDLGRFMAKHNVRGDAVIRDGVVYAAVPDTRIDPLVRMLRGSIMLMQQDDAIRGDLYYAVKNPGLGTGWTYRCSGICVSDVEEIVQLLERKK